MTDINAEDIELDDDISEAALRELENGVNPEDGSQIPEEDLDPSPEKPQYDNQRPKPPTEQQLDALQERYLSEGRPDAVWKEMFLVCVPYAKSLILKKIKSKLFLEQEYINECAVSVVLKFLNHYKTNPTFKVDWSFAGMMNYKVLEVLFGPKKEDRHVSLNQYMTDDSKGELGDYLTKIGYRNIMNLGEEKFYNPENSLNTGSYSFNTVKEVLAELDKETADNPRIQVLARLRVLMMFRYPRSRHADSVFKKQFALDYREECVLDQVLLEVRNRLKNIV